jgi:hypothetical protein
LGTRLRRITSFAEITMAASLEGTERATVFKMKHENSLEQMLSTMNAKPETGLAGAQVENDTYWKVSNLEIAAPF